MKETMFEDLRAYCMFIGYPRSGHTLIGSLVNAHPDVVVCHELDALGLIDGGITRRELYERILAKDEDFAAKGRKHVYDYAVDGAWHGRWRRLRIIGDKKGAKSSRRLYRKPELLDTLAETVRLPLRLLHVIRSPWDNIATMTLRGAGSPEQAEALLPSTAEHYFQLCESVRRVRARRPAVAMLDIYHEDFVADPRLGLKQLSDFLEIEWDETWAAACQSIVYVKPHRSRFAVPWPAGLIDRIRAEMDRFPWLRPEYRTFGEPSKEEARARVSS